MAEWLDHSTAKQKVAGSNPTRASGWKTPSVHPAVKWVPDLIQGRKGSRRRGMGSAFHMLCPRHSEPLTVRRPNGDLYFFLNFLYQKTLTKEITVQECFLINQKLLIR